MSTPPEEVVSATRIGVVGCGYVGISTALGLHTLGFDVTALDVDPIRIDALCSGDPVIEESGLVEVLAAALDSGGLRFATGTELGGVDVVFLCVPTPLGVRGAADLSILRNVVDAMSGSLADDVVLVVKSTVPAGTCAQVEEMLRERGCGAAVVSNPEFLREGRAMADFFAPDRIVIGGPDAAAVAKVAALYAALDARIITTDWATAELSKQAANAYLASRVSFVNGLAQLANAVGAEVDTLLEALGADSRIGPHFLKPGPGWGGACLPKDTAAIVALGRSHGVELHIANAAVIANASHQGYVAELIRSSAGGSLRNRTVAVWGLAFKAGTGDLRDSPALALIAMLLVEGAIVRGYDPTVAPEHLLEGVSVCSSAIDACTGSDVLVVATEWREFAEIDFVEIASVMNGRAVVDARNCLPADAVRAAGLDYTSLGIR